MPKMSVYLPDDLYREVKRASLNISAILQQALNDELELRREIEVEMARRRIMSRRPTGAAA